MTPLPTVSQSSATVNPYGCPACLRDGAPGHPAYGPGLERGMLTPPRCSKSRLHRQRIRAKFSLSLYRPLPDRGRTGRCEVSRGNHRLPSCSPTPIITCRAARLTCYVLTATLWRAPRYPRDEEGCALLPRHHAEPKELLSTDHFDATPPEVGMTLVTPRPSRVSARGASPHRCAFHLLRRDRRNLELLFPSLSNRDFTARSPRRHEDAKKSFAILSRLRVFVANRMPALPGERRKILCKSKGFSG